MKLGRILKEARIKRGISLSEVAKALLVQERYIEAIEDDIDELLPSGTYKRIYTRAYCRYLGVEFKEAQPEVKVAPDDKSEKTDSAAAKKPDNVSVESDDEINLDLPFDIDRALRIAGKLILTAIVIYAIVKIFQWIF